MDIYHNRQWIEDIDEVLSTLPELEKLAGSSVLVTGSSGLIGSALVQVLARWNDIHKTQKIRVLAAGRDEASLKARFAAFKEKPWFEFVVYDVVSGALKGDCICEYIIHGAGNASPNKIVNEPVETMLGNFMGTYRLLEHARYHNTKRLLFISSSEVYGRLDGNKPFCIEDYGYLDLLQPRSSYAMGKRAAETLCVSSGVEWNVDSVIVRPGHIYGPTARESDNRVSSAWAYAAALGKDIVMKSDGSQLRSYCYVLDCVTAIFKVLLCGKSMHAYNISNPNSVISIKKLAEILSKVGGCDLRMELPSKTDKAGFNPMLNSSLDASELIALGWESRFEATRGLEHTVKILRKMIVNK